ncbi:MAG: type 1 glutamine amidotransferase [Gluconacetobacter sp.]|uniref:Type 1 glutamine amidotransferase n=1 Tax=Gluconacetobacter dulcium TaxID=2729096 RepID=A0A7W4JYM0_9PROT|nr:type 1 glutamine amidotransferase [Gluconacetobacter dulcium]MBB2197113.1 type 1 glutamine amidotransferase [Gluconacetobacter dulcium]
MGRLLYLANGASRTSPARLEEFFSDQGVDVDVFWAFDGEFPERLDRYQGVLLSGSPHAAYDDVPFIHREHDLIREGARRNLPMLGLCFGHQILASALCGRDQVFRRAYCEVGYKWLETRPDAMGDQLCDGLGEATHMFVWHNDEVRADHPDMRIIAASDVCPNHIWRYRDQQIWGVQGHPEIPLERAPDWLNAVRSRLERDGANVDDLIAQASDANGGKTMLRRFAGIVRG